MEGEQVFKMHTKVTDVDSQVICYLDVNSLYPYVMSKTNFSIGHPQYVKVMPPASI